jgi:hypothetical protein
MSETIEATEAPPLPLLPNFSVTQEKRKHGAESLDVLVVSYGTLPGVPSKPEHTLEVRRLDMGDNFDLAEIAGHNAGNLLWMNLAMVAASVVMIDGRPLPLRTLSKPGLKSVLRDLGPNGVRAVGDALNQDGADIGQFGVNKEVVGN